MPRARKADRAVAGCPPAAARRKTIKVSKQKTGPAPAKRASLLAIMSLLSCLVVTACAASGPAVRTDANDGFGPLLPECQNLRRDKAERRFITEFYLSTWGSAWMEGAGQGVSEGLNARGSGDGENRLAAAVQTRDRPRGVRTTMLLVPPKPYCRAVAMPADDLQQAIQTVLASVARPVVAVAADGTQMETAFTHARHRAARWYDKYIVSVTQVTPDTSAVRILRPLFISRDGTVYNHAYSSGANEGWLMDEAERVARDARR